MGAIAFQGGAKAAVAYRSVEIAYRVPLGSVAHFWIARHPQPIGLQVFAEEETGFGGPQTKREASRNSSS